jgi:hypothetical protein
MISVLPVLGLRGHDYNGEQFVSVASVDYALLQMKENAAKSDNCSPDHTEAIEAIREAFANVTWRPRP